MQVLVNERCVKALALVNSGLLKFDYVWKVGIHAKHEHSPRQQHGILAQLCSDSDAVHAESCCQLQCGRLTAFSLQTRSLQTRSHGPRFPLVLAGW